MDNVCRTCLNTSHLSLLKDDESLIDKIETISSINILLDVPNFPNTICSDCVNKVNQFYCFRKIIINTDKELREKSEILNHQIPKKKHISTKRKRTSDKPVKVRSPRKTKKIQSKVVSTSTPDENIKLEPTEDNLYIDQLVICENAIGEADDKADITVVQNSVKQETENSDAQDSLICPICSLSFPSKIELINHKKSSHKQKYRRKTKSLDCVECNTEFSSLTELANHKRTVHTAPGICSICGVIVRADNLKKHVQKHSEDPVSCKICSKVLKNTESLRGHLLIHRGTQFECEQCDKTFTLKSEYHRHLKKHIDPNVRKKMCTICGKHVRDMQRHLFTHTGERPYICTHCNKGLTSSYALKLHIRQHTNEKPYICEFCKKGFAQKISLVAHLKSKVHNTTA